ncbi:MAG TPA: glycosyltransferase family 2 protein [Caulobacteraceae bacterium]|nr:glycosyltransferase family 2 protein [Caulobacteraceae bacterium]
MGRHDRIGPGHPCVAVIIAAKNAAASIGEAVRSALAEPETAEVVVIDDGSTDATAQVARAADDGSGRLRVVGQANTGPAQARNRAVAMSKAPVWCVLDADDRFVSGRLARLLREGGADWDLLADAIRFVHPDDGYEELRPVGPLPRDLGFVEFVEGNTPRRVRRQRELGFLQPLMRRAFCDAAGLCYRPELRLGEDYALYAEALAAGARFRCVDAVGYLATVTPGSLSQHHRAEDFLALKAFDRALLATAVLDPPGRRAVRRHMGLMRLKAEYLRVVAALEQGRPLQALARGLAGPQLAGFLFNHLYRARISRALKRLLPRKGVAAPAPAAP